MSSKRTYFASVVLEQPRPQGGSFSRGGPWGRGWFWNSPKRMHPKFVQEVVNPSGGRYPSYTVCYAVCHTVWFADWSGNISTNWGDLPNLVPRPLCALIAHAQRAVRSLRRLWVRDWDLPNRVPSHFVEFHPLILRIWFMIEWWQEEAAFAS